MSATPSSTPEAEPPTVILLHGLGRTRLAMLPLAWHLGRRGFPTRNLGYFGPAGLEASVAQVLRHVDEVLAAAPGRRIHFVTHSMGGIVARAVLAARPFPLPGRLVQLAPPNQGATLADRVGRVPLLRAVPALRDLGCASLAGLGAAAPARADSAPADRASPAAGAADGGGDGGDDGGGGGGDGGDDGGGGGGDGGDDGGGGGGDGGDGGDGGVAPRRCAIPPLEGWEVGVIAGKSFGPWHGGHDSDGVVRVSETYLPEARDWILLPRFHTVIMSARETWANVDAFLRTGRFLPGAARLALAPDGAVRLLASAAPEDALDADPGGELPELP